jgi:hypothetical protein
VRFFESKFAALAFMICFSVIAIVASIPVLNMFAKSVDVIGTVVAISFILLIAIVIKVTVTPKDFLLTIWKNLFRYLGWVFLILGILIGVFVENGIISAVSNFAFGCTLLCLKVPHQKISNPQ